MENRPKNFTKHYEFIYDIFLKKYALNNISPSLRGFCSFLGISLGKRQAWQERGQWPSAEDLETLHNKMGFSYRWLVTGEGEPYRDDITTPQQETPQAPAPAPQSVCSGNGVPTPLLGFASCGVDGWHGVMTIPVPVAAVAWPAKLYCVMTSGQIVLPARSDRLRAW